MLFVVAVTRFEHPPAGAVEGTDSLRLVSRRGRSRSEEPCPAAFTAQIGVAWPVKFGHKPTFMKAVLTSFFTVCAAVSLTAADTSYSFEDPYAGYYEGVFPVRDGETKVEAQIRPLGGGNYTGFIVVHALNRPDRPIYNLGKFEVFKPIPGETNTITGFHPNPRGDEQNYRKEFNWPDVSLMGDLEPGLLKGRLYANLYGRVHTNSFNMVRKPAPSSPTLGAKPPQGAIVIFDGKDHGQWKENNWDIVDGALQVGKGNLTTKESMENFLLHLEFRTPYMPEATGQARGNSGVYLRSAFEVQVLDSFGLFPLANNDCGGIYQVAEPDWRAVNACMPPGQWQTYDITYREGSEKENRLPVVTVVHNGKTIVDRVKIPLKYVVQGTGGGDPNGGYLMLQDHGNPVQYRNIWVQPLE